MALCWIAAPVAWPLAASSRSASVQAVPSGLTFSDRSSSPASPISARPDQPLCSTTLAVSAGAALLILSRWSLPSWLKRLASAATASRAPLSGLGFTPVPPRVAVSPGRGSGPQPVPSKSTSAPASRS
ncbi:hypothetical protein HC022_02705 [Salipiger sp. HF18]|uniref:hypothetical protein n=1 Tax=Salipiger sp. HF18 TaxID=2721557 RepID=UPI00142E3D22|nr:hypothetical protein [Salipiger sp. HF18]NIY95197.1 hypothetical protein [Salipiger sp. HF18]